MAPPDAREAGRWLGRLVRDVPGARGYLGRLSSAIQPLATFRDVFPAEFRRARRELGRDPETGLCTAQAKLLKLMGRRLFPLAPWGWDGEPWEEGAGTIPVMPLLPTELYEDDVASLPAALRLAFYLVHTDDPEGQIASDEDLRGARPGLEIRGAADLGSLAALCRRRRGPSRHFLLAVRIVARESGNAWYDGLCDASHKPSHVTGAVM